MNAVIPIFLALLIFLAGEESVALSQTTKEMPIGYANGVQHAYTYNPVNRLTNLGVNRLSTPSSTLQALHSYAYTLNKNGHRIQISELSGRLIQNTFDALHRLTVESISRSVGVPPTSSHEGLGTLSYAYDLVGNRQSRAVSGNATLGSLLPNQTQAFTVNDRPTTDTYDANGNTTGTADVPSASSSSLLSSVSQSSVSDIYSFDNRLIRRTTADGKTIDLIHNPDGHRLIKHITSGGLTQRVHHYLTDANNPTGYAQVIEEKDSLSGTGVSPESSIDPTLSKVHLYGHDLIATETKGSTPAPGVPAGAPPGVFYYSYDGLGSIRSITNETGDLQETYDYDAYGTVIGLAKRNAEGVLDSSPITYHSAPITQSEFLFTGEQFDSDLGMYFLRARYLNTNTGRFHSQDTYEGRNGEPLTLHKYLYANGNPVMYLDPSGMFAIWLLGIELHKIIGVHFERSKPTGRFSDLSIGSIIREIQSLGEIASTEEIEGNLLKRPDLTDTNSKEVWEIKPHKRYREGLLQLRGYLGYLRSASPSAGSKHGRRVSYTPPSVIPLQWGFIAEMEYHKYGVITYKLHKRGRGQLRELAEDATIAMVSALLWQKVGAANSMAIGGIRTLSAISTSRSFAY